MVLTMDDLDTQINAAVLRIRDNQRRAQHRLNLKMSVYQGVPTIHTCGAKPSADCAACTGRPT